MYSPHLLKLLVFYTMLLLKSEARFVTFHVFPVHLLVHVGRRHSFYLLDLNVDHVGHVCASVLQPTVLLIMSPSFFIYLTNHPTYTTCR
jgi:hypothetical protein